VNPRFEILDAIELYLDALHAKGLQAGTLLCYAYHLRSFRSASPDRAATPSTP
jgi:hypothetical protein